MRPSVVLSLVPFAIFASAASATEQGAAPEAWRVDGATVALDAAGVILPIEVGGLNLVKSGEISQGGSGIDNYAQFTSPDGVVQATAYIYLPSYADAGIAAYVTDQAVHEHFGAATRRTAFSAVAAGGTPAGALRAFYENAADGALVTGAAFIHAGRWIVKLRVTGPTERSADVRAGLDSMLSAIRFAPGTAVQPAIARDVTPCAEEDRQAQGFCIRGTLSVDGAQIAMLQPRGDGDTVLIPLDDAGQLMMVEKLPRNGGYQLSMHAVGRTDIYDVCDHMPSNQQIAAILNGSDPATAKPRSSTAYEADGTATTAAR
jgi:hypothetical protein